MKQWAVFLVVLALCALPLGAHAVINIPLDTGNDAIDGFTGPYGTVSVLLVDTTHATITFDANSVDPNDYLFGRGRGGGQRQRDQLHSHRYHGQQQQPGLHAEPVHVRRGRRADGRLRVVQRDHRQR